MFQRQSLTVLGAYHQGYNRYLLSIILLEKKYWQTCFAECLKTWILEICLCLTQVMNDRLCRSQQHEVGVPRIWEPPWWRVKTSLAGLSFVYTSPGNPHQPHLKCVGSKKRVCCWALGPVYRSGSSRVTSHQTLGPLKHIWVAPAVPRAIRISTERREPEQHKNGFRLCRNQDFANTMFFSGRKGEIWFV